MGIFVFKRSPICFIFLYYRYFFDKGIGPFMNGECQKTVKAFDHIFFHEDFNKTELPCKSKMNYRSCIIVQPCKIVLQEKDQ